ncbi:MAG: STT3 domain-containing protein, partial [Halobacteriota archaeon]|nr:STT3 domain-containing protein [Halobacteriota archaeon]
TIESIGALFPVFLGAFTVFPVYFISKEIFDDKVGILAALIFALTPAHIYVSYLGKPDHHVAEAFFSLMAFLFFLVALKNYENKMIWKSHLSSIISGLMMGSIILIWPGSPMFVGIFVIFATSQFVINQRRERPSNSLMIAGVAVFFVTLIMIALGGSDRFEMIMISLTAFLFFVLGSLSNFMRDRHINWFYYLLSLTVMALTLLFTMPLLMPQFYRGFTSGFGFLGRSGECSLPDVAS